MNKILVGVVAVALAGGGLWYFRSGSGEAASVGTGAPGAAAGRGGGRGGRGAVPMTVDVSTVGRSEVIDYVTVVGNLIGRATVDVVPRVAGRLESVNVQLGDRVSRGQAVAKLEDRAIREQVNQVRANISVNEATLKARENDAVVAKNSLDRARTSFEGGLVSQQALEDAEARYSSALSQVQVAQAQMVSTQARLDELSVTLSDTSVLSPVDGFVGRRNLDSGAFAGANTPIISVVDIGIVRMVANLVEKDFRRVQAGAPALVEVDAFPGEQFTGHVSRVAPVFDPATRTATMEIEVPNPGYRLKPGMYARVRLTAERKPDALTVDRAAVVDVQGRRGVYVVEEGDVARFREVETGLSNPERIEVVSGVSEGTRVVTTGALAIRDGERILTAEAARGGGRGGPRGGATPAPEGRAQGTPPSSRGAS
jgi:RND family efflux transporter MFP subunit